MAESNGLAIKNPWPNLQPRRLSWSNCAGISIPSAITLRFMLCVTIDLMISSPLPDPSSAPMNARSIFNASSGLLLVVEFYEPGIA